MLSAFRSTLQASWREEFFFVLVVGDHERVAPSFCYLPSWVGCSTDRHRARRARPKAASTSLTRSLRPPVTTACEL